MGWSQRSARFAARHANVELVPLRLVLYKDMCRWRAFEQRIECAQAGTHYARVFANCSEQWTAAIAAEMPKLVCGRSVTASFSCARDNLKTSIWRGRGGAKFCVARLFTTIAMASHIRSDQFRGPVLNGTQGREPLCIANSPPTLVPL